MKFPFSLKNQADLDVVGFGTNAVDFLIRVPQYPDFDSKIELSGYTQAAGGEVATTVAGLQRLGARTAYAGRFGAEPTGDFGIQSLRDEGVDTRFAEQIEGAVTQIAFILIDERSGERTVIWKRDPKLAYGPDDAPPEIAEMGKILHFTPHDTEACSQLAAGARQAGVIVSVDIDNTFAGMEGLLPNVDILISSSAFPAKAIGARSFRDGLLELNRRYGCSITGMTLGRTGSLLLCDGQFIETDGFDVPGGCKDTTGAGDAFRSGFLYGLLEGRSVETSARMANAVAALKCRAVGARTALPTKQELEDLVSDSER